MSVKMPDCYREDLTLSEIKSPQGKVDYRRILFLNKDVFCEPLEMEDNIRGQPLQFEPT